jgi:hypothetical protein
MLGDSGASGCHLLGGARMKGRLGCGNQIHIHILQGKQKSFLKNIRKQRSHTMQGLDFYIDQVKATLRQVIRGMRSSEDTDKSLFMLAEDIFQKSTVLVHLICFVV